GFSGMRISDHEGVHKFAQVNGSLKPSIEGTDIDWKDWQKRGYAYLGVNTDRDYIVGVGYYLLVGKVGVQAGNYYEKAIDKDYFCVGLYADASILRKFWEVIKPLIDTYSNITK
ncbi:MAG: hypothetical protein AB1567_08500, partial [bacterium]